MTETIAIDQASHEDISTLWGMSSTLRQGKLQGYFERCLERQDKGELSLYIMRYDAEAVGYCLLNWQPKYGMFRTLNIPEIQDLNVLPDYRKRGFATQMITYCEKVAGEQDCREMGIGVGLNRSFGAAQRLYVQLGYIPDGQGINYDRKPMEESEFRPNDDQLCLMMTKLLNEKGIIE